MAEETFIVNPESGRATHEPAVRERADRRGALVLTSEAPGDAVRLAREATRDGADTIVAVGGDGTVNEVVRGIAEADELSSRTLGIIPAGTGNGFAGNVGITDIDHGFELLDHGERRRVDLGWANDRPFLNSCIAGVTAEASVRTSASRKARLGVIAYVLTTLETMRDVRGLTVNAVLGNEEVWSGAAGLVMVGNARQFSVAGGRPAPIEDGQLDLTIIEDPSRLDLVTDVGMDRLFGSRSPDLMHRRADDITIDVTDEVATFSLDGELVTCSTMACRCASGVLTLIVGEGYESDPT